MYTEELNALCKISHCLGSDAMCVFGGGGNCSVKTEGSLLIKASGSQLAGITPDDFVKMDRRQLRDILEVSLPGNSVSVERACRQLLLSARYEGQLRKPSVEVLVHELMPQTFVFHAHPVLANGLLCSKDAIDSAKALFPDALIVPYCDPGYPMAQAIAKGLEALGKHPNIIMIQNHGIFLGADSAVGITNLYEMIEERLCDVYEKAQVSQGFSQGVMDKDMVMNEAPILRSYLGTATRRAVVNAAPPFTPAPGPLTPDHLTYAGKTPLCDALTPEAITTYEEAHGIPPNIIEVPGKAIFAAGQTLRDAELALQASRNAAEVLQLTAAFGGPNYLSDAACQYVNAIESTPLRERTATALDCSPLGGKVILITGAAQGFGYGIAQDMAKRGATVIVADLNLEGAVKAADELIAEFGVGTALPVKVNISDEAAVAEMAEEIVHRCGGLDVMIANAGVLKAGSVKSLEKRDWDFVTNVNYTGYFLCVKHIAQIMSKQNLPSGKGGWMDIIQVSSKSGLEGSNRNGAYAGSKFGGIGLTQSFAMELVSDRVKVNSICPGNFFDGPLWSDPNNGLFVQYLNSGKVPGAESIDEVRGFYEAKVPMGRGCLPADVSVAIEYVIKQQYETGQAVPVTGGQVMLN